MSHRGPARHPRVRPRLVPGRGLVAAAIVGWVGLLALIPANPTSAAVYDRFDGTFQAQQLARVVNADRAALGLPALQVDSGLAAVARDRSLTCPSRSSLTIRGRARDMADRGYLSHQIQGCRKRSGAAFDAFDLLAAFGYTWSAVGENIATNNYPATATTYATGCNTNGGSCSGRVTGVPWAVAVVERGWMSSSAHRANVLSRTFRRLGCGAWDGSGGQHYYACYFIAGGTSPRATSGSGGSRATATPRARATAGPRTPAPSSPAPTGGAATPTPTSSDVAATSGAAAAGATGIPPPTGPVPSSASAAAEPSQGWWFPAIFLVGIVLVGLLAGGRQKAASATAEDPSGSAAAGP
jgi:uncharacterized protein YkwD